MKSQLSTLTALVSTLAAPLVSAHYVFPYFIANGVESGQWQYNRMTQNHYSLGPVTNVSDPLMKCYENDTASATSTITVTAGNSYTFGADQAIYHPGYIDVYMSTATPSAGTESAGSGQTWFKIFEDAPVFVDSTTGYIFPDETATTVNFTIPKDTPSGDYLIRVEQIALHVASSYGGAQFYIACAQVTVTGGGSGVPGPLVSIPGVYTGYEPGILIDIYPTYPDGAYISPGPAVWTGGSSSTGSTTTSKTSSTTSKASTSTTSTTAKTSTTSTTVKTSTTSTTSTKTSTGSASTSTSSGAALYGQCGGQGWTGPTTCAQGTCTYENAYYSQCL